MSLCWRPSADAVRYQFDTTPSVAEAFRRRRPSLFYKCRYAGDLRRTRSVINSIQLLRSPKPSGVGDLRYFINVVMLATFGGRGPLSIRYNSVGRRSL